MGLFNLFILAFILWFYCFCVFIWICVAFYSICYSWCLLFFFRYFFNISLLIFLRSLLGAFYDLHIFDSTRRNMYLPVVPSVYLLVGIYISDLIKKNKHWFYCFSRYTQFTFACVWNNIFHTDWWNSKTCENHWQHTLFLMCENTKSLWVSKHSCTMDDPSLDDQFWLVKHYFLLADVQEAVLS